MMRYYTDIALANPGIPIRQYVIYTGGPSLTMADSVQHEHWDYRYTLIDMHNLDCERFIEEDNPDALVLAILCDFKEKNSAQVIERIIERLIQLTGKQPDKLRNYLKMMESLSSNRDLSDEFKKVEKKMLTEIDIEKLPSYRIGLEQGVILGEARGEARGEAKTQRQLVLNAHRQGLDKQVIAAVTGLSVEKIDELLASDDFH